MREIKFKAIFKRGRAKSSEEYKTIYYGTAFGVVRFPYPYGWKLIAKDLQYAGRNDESGKEIYEGDIIESDDKIIEVVSFTDGEFTGSYYGMKPIFESWKIIGNKHENKELLNG